MALMAGILLLSVGAIFIILAMHGFDPKDAPNVAIWKGLRKLVTNQ